MSEELVLAETLVHILFDSCWECSGLAEAVNVSVSDLMDGEGATDE